MPLQVKLGVAGAAIATVLGNCLAIIYFMAYRFTHKESCILEMRPRYATDMRGLLDILALGLPNAISSLLSGFAGTFSNRLLVTYGTAAVAAMAAASKGTMVITMVQMGICMGVQPLMAYCYGGQKWERIQAHGGAVFYEDGVYYWYGENKEHTDGQNGIWTWGLKVYSSTDLCNWEDRGFLIPPVLEDPNCALFPAKRVDRPHILRCDKTGKYVCWIKLSGPEAAFTIWQADALLGPYEMVENLVNPGGHKAGDFDMIKDEETGKAYLYFDAEHSAMLCMELSDDYLRAEKEVCRSYAGLFPPFTREAPALFEAFGRKYMVTSGMTGYVPNKSDSAVSDSWDSEFVSLGDPHVDDETTASFNSQISKIFRVEGRDNLFVAMADRWLPHYHVDARIADIFTRTIACNYAPDKYQANDEERAEMYRGNILETADTSVADYVWLPIQLDAPCEGYPNGRVRIEWKDSWTI